MTEQTEREAFEAWLGRRYPLADATGDDDAREHAPREPKQPTRTEAANG